QESRLDPGVLQDPGEHARRGRLAVGAGDGHDVPPVKHVARQPLRPGAVRQAALEHGLHCRVAARHRVPDHDAVGCGLELVLREALGHVDAQAAELGAHRRVDVLVAAGDPVAGCGREGRDAAHERPADAEYVQVHAAVSSPAPQARARWSWNAYLTVNAAIATAPPANRFRLSARDMICPSTNTDQKWINRPIRSAGFSPRRGSNSTSSTANASIRIAPQPMSVVNVASTRLACPAATSTKPYRPSPRASAATLSVKLWATTCAATKVAKNSAPTASASSSQDDGMCSGPFRSAITSRKVRRRRISVLSQ